MSQKKVLKESGVSLVVRRVGLKKKRKFSRLLEFGMKIKRKNVAESQE